MMDPKRALFVFTKHFHWSRDLSVRQGFVALELGPGDSLFSALTAYSFGASGTYLIDVGTFATDDVNDYRRMTEYLVANGLPSPDLSDATSLGDVLRVCGSSYGPSGLKSFREVSSESVDFIWSDCVLQHVRRDELPEVIKEMRRVIRPGGICSHTVELHDHLGGNLNHLRFSERLWEWQFMAESGFYTNRYRLSQLLLLFEKEGFKPEIHGVEYWENIPIPRLKMAAEFRMLAEEDLLVKKFDVLLRPV